MKSERIHFLAFTTIMVVSSIFSSCQKKSHYKVRKITSTRILIDSIFDKNPNQYAIDILSPYKKEIHQKVYTIIGKSAKDMTSGIPESLLGNLVADILRLSSTRILKEQADIGLINVGGLRASLPKGPITNGRIFKILPFDNSLTVLTLTGVQVKQLMEQIAETKGQGISNAQLVITRKGKLISATIGGKAIDLKKTYTLATVDYLAGGNDGLCILSKSIKKIKTKFKLRDITLDYIKGMTKKNKIIDAKIEGRITLKK